MASALVCNICHKVFPKEDLKFWYPGNKPLCKTCTLCSICHRVTETFECDRCGKPVCLRHMSISGGLCDNCSLGRCHDCKQKTAMFQAGFNRLCSACYMKRQFKCNKCKSIIGPFVFTIGPIPSPICIRCISTCEVGDDLH